MSEQPPESGPGPSRRRVIQAATVGVVSAVAGLGAGIAIGRSAAPDSAGAAPAIASSSPTLDPPTLEASHHHQLGVAVPATPQRSNVVAVLRLDAPAGLRDALAQVGERIAVRTAEHSTDSLTITVGVGPRVVSGTDPTILGPGLPAFADDAELTPETSGGDVLVIAAASDASILEDVIADVTSPLAGTSMWRQHGFRGAGEDGLGRNPFHFIDGIIIPRTDSELDENVWIPEGPFAGGTICVIRRLSVDTAAFRELTIAEQEATFGRTRIDGAPLEGGSTMDEVDLLAKTAEGEFITPVNAHVRAAHPSFTGSGLMLRRSYGFDSGTDKAGMLFICFQAELSTFVQTQHRLDEGDALRQYMTPTASGAWVILPSTAPLGAPLSAPSPR